MAEFIEDLLLIVSMATTINQSRRTTHITLIFFRPFNNLYVFRAIFHCFDSSIARRTARTW